MTWYFDTSALTKLITTERESHSLAEARAVGGWIIASSELVRTELARAALRKGASVDAFGAFLRRLDLIPLERRVLDVAGRLQPPALRSLDAIHIASALALGTACEGFVTYDLRMREAAELAGLIVISPGA